MIGFKLFKRKVSIPAVLAVGTSFAAFWIYTLTNGDQAGKANNTLMRSLVTLLQSHPVVIEHLGAGQVVLAGKVSGDLNIIKGRADIEFPIKSLATDKHAIVHFKGRSLKDCDFWKSTEFTLKTKEESSEEYNLDLSHAK